jgi:hypothetical protein
MSRYKKDWDAMKAELARTNLNTDEIFKQKLGKALDALEKAQQTYLKMGKNDKTSAVSAAKKTRGEAATAALKICHSYIECIESILAGTPDAAQKTALKKAVKFLWAADKSIVSAAQQHPTI